jgi:hypothetical protein
MIGKNIVDCVEITSLGEIADSFNLACRSDSQEPVDCRVCAVHSSTISGYKAWICPDMAELGGFGRRTQIEEVLTSRDCKMYRKIAKVATVVDDKHAGAHK